MSSSTTQEGELIQVTVHYIAATRPFKVQVRPSETVGQLKAETLAAFGLTEGSGSGGTLITYTLFHGKTPLDNLSETVGTVADHRKDLELKLVQQIAQGFGRSRLEHIRAEP